LRSLPSTPDYSRGGALVLIGLALLSVGRLGGLMALQAFSLIVTLSGLVLFRWGPRVFRVGRFPLAYLLLAMPVWDYLFWSIQLPGQRAAATMATALLRTVGVPALNHGITIDLPNVSLEVMAECSGINQLLALTTMAIPAAYLWIDTRARRACLVLIAIVLGYLSNGLRVAILGWLTWQGYRVSDPHSVVHLAPGFFSVGIAYLVLGGCLTWLSKANLAQQVGAASISTAPLPAPAARRQWFEFALLIVMICTGASQLTAMPRDQAQRRVLEAVPRRVAEWTLESSVEPRGVRFAGFDHALLHAYPNASGQYRFAALDEEILRTYRHPSGSRVQLYIGYYGSQENDKELTGDVSRLLHKVASTVAVIQGTEAIALKEVVQQRDEGPRGVVFWYVVNGRVVSNIYVAKLHTLWDAMTKWRTKGVVVMVAWDGANTDPERARAAALEFSGSLLAQPRIADW
jgi:EpsI family protein